jgi:PAS domain S-box-containing protein
MLASYMTWPRLLGLALAALVTTSVALIAAHSLWEHSPGPHTRERVVLFNAVTTLTIAIGVLTLYLAVAEVSGTTPELAAPVTTEQFTREHQRVLNAKLLTQVEELERVNQEQQRLHEELLLAQRQTVESLILLETLQQTAPVGIAFVDRAFRIQRMNEKLAAMTGLARERVVGRTLEEVAPDRWPEAEPFYRHVLRTGQVVINQDAGEGPRRRGSRATGLRATTRYASMTRSSASASSSSTSPSAARPTSCDRGLRPGLPPRTPVGHGLVHAPLGAARSAAASR